MKSARRRVVLGYLMALALYACNNDTNQQKDVGANEDTPIVTANTDIALLQASTIIPGKPNAVWWVRAVAGKPGADKVPGPTDSLLTAIIDYGSTDVVAKLVGVSGGRSVRLVSADWFPDVFMNSATDNEGRIPAQQYKNVPGYHPDAIIRVPESVPSFIIVELVSG